MAVLFKLLTENYSSKYGIQSKTDVPHYSVVNFNGWLYFGSEPKYSINNAGEDEFTIWIEPEAYDFVQIGYVEKIV